ncbi:MAG: hypothetical protein WCY27_02155 [archaeon]|nr:hypothetical protein [archaeon]MDD2477720.1 hypothetical protein [Candidatus ainarchaeum sp.]MDD3084573.1 hypothetical protein [Candidatus ainarchaeum sp.]MDD4221297.1 hypothetical protein [Candidatus ainarchaeum sp.]MDD4662769.1 hypothetical protein [Candidatus ainarchaeum sp.]
MQKTKASKKGKNLVSKKKNSSSKKSVVSTSKKNNSLNKTSKLKKNSKLENNLNLKKVPNLKKVSSKKVNLPKVKVKKKDKPLQVKTIMELKEPITSSKTSFFKELFGLKGYYKLVWIPIVVLLFIIFFDFAFNLVMNTSFPSIFVSFFKSSFLYKLFVFFIVLINFFAYLVFSSEAVRHNFKLKDVFNKILNLTLVLFIIEIILITISNFIFLKNNLIFVSVSKNILYILYLYLWVVIKAFVLMCVFLVSYILFKKSKQL